MAAELIGRCRCPLCGSTKARLTLAKSMLAVLTCNGCNFQGFARSDRSDEALRALIVPDAPAAEPVRTEPAPEPVQTPAAPVAAKPAPVRPAPPQVPAKPVPPQPEQPAAKSVGWGFFI